MKPFLKIFLMAVAYLAIFILGASSGAIHPACYAYAGAVLALLAELIRYLLGYETRKGVRWSSVPLAFKYGSGKGWRYAWHKDDPAYIYHFECLECLYKYEFSKHGVLERFGPMFCHSDIINYGNLHNIDFIRTRTLCQGGDCCDFRFVRHKKGEVWERTKSI